MSIVLSVIHQLPTLVQACTSCAGDNGSGVPPAVGIAAGIAAAINIIPGWGGAGGEGGAPGGAGQGGSAGQGLAAVGVDILGNISPVSNVGNVLSAATAVNDLDHAAQHAWTGDTAGARRDLGDALTDGYGAVPMHDAAWDLMTTMGRGIDGPGNHDLTWNDGGDQVFRSAWGGTGAAAPPPPPAPVPPTPPLGPDYPPVPPPPTEITLPTTEITGGPPPPPPPPPPATGVEGPAGCVYPGP